MDGERVHPAPALMSTMTMASERVSRPSPRQIMADTKSFETVSEYSTDRI